MKKNGEAHIKNKLTKYPFHGNINNKLGTFRAEINVHGVIDLDRVIFVHTESLSDIEYKEIGLYLEQINDLD